MRQATVEDIGVLDAISHQAGLEPLAHSVLDGCIILLGEHGYIIADPMDDAKCIIHVTTTPRGRGKWGKEFMRDALRWLFATTRVESIVAMVPKGNPHVIAFAKDAWFSAAHQTDSYTYMYIDMLGWIAHDPKCLAEGAHGASDYALADSEMVKRVTGACVLMHEAGMGHKAWYIYRLYAKLFGYKAEG